MAILTLYSIRKWHYVYKNKRYLIVEWYLPNNVLNPLRGRIFFSYFDIFFQFKYFLNQLQITFTYIRCLTIFDLFNQNSTYFN